MVKPGESGPSFVQKPYIDQSPDGKLLTFKCQISGNPKPSFTWYRNAVEIRDGGRYYMDVLPKGNAFIVSLELQNVSPDDAGTYKVVAKNQFGESSGTIALNFGQQSGGGGEQQIEGTAPRFTMKPVMKQSDDGKTLTIQSELQASPRPSIQWTRNGIPITDGGKISIRIEADEDFYFLSLTISNVAGSDGGDYVVFAKNALGESTSTIKLNFEDKPAAGAPIFTMKPHINQSKDGRRLTFECEIKATPRPTITWYKEDMVLQDGGRFMIDAEEDRDFYFAMLEIDNITPKDGGEYRVIAKNKHGDSTQTINLNFDSEPSAPAKAKGLAPSFAGKPVMKQSKDGHHMSFESELTADPRPQITWYHGDRLLQDGGRIRIIIEKEGSTGYFLVLELADVTPTDGGVYTVVAKNEYGESKATINLNFDIRAAPDSGRGPSFPEKPSIRQEDGGRILIMEQKVISDPRPTVIWKHNDILVQDSSHHRISITQEANLYVLKLEVHDVTPEDGGIYTINARNSKGQGNSTITINFNVQQIQMMQQRMKQPKTMQMDFGDIQESVAVDGAAIRKMSKTQVSSSKYVSGDEQSGISRVEESMTSITTSTAVEGAEKATKPVFAEGLKNQNAMDGDEVIFRVRMTGFPAPQITWYRNGKVINNSANFKIKRQDDVYILHIVEVFPEDSGKYTCEAVNASGKVTSLAVLEVKEPATKKPVPKKDEPAAKKKPEPVEETIGKTTTKPAESAPPKGKPMPVEEPIGKTTTKPAESAPPKGKPTPVEEPIGKTTRAPAESAPPSEIEKPKKDKRTPVEEPIGKTTTAPAESAPPSETEKPKKDKRTPVEEPIGKTTTAPAESAPPSETEKPKKDKRVPVEEPIGKKPIIPAESEPPSETEKPKKDKRVPVEEPIGKKPIAPAESAPTSEKEKPKKDKPIPVEEPIGKKPTAPAESAPPSEIEKPKKDKPTPVEEPIGKTTTKPAESAPPSRTEKPKFLEQLKRQSVMDGDEVIFRTRVSGIPAPVVTWYRDGTIIKPSIDFEIKRQKDVCTLNIVEVFFPDDTGDYSCKAVNTAGEATIKTHLEVKEPPPKKPTPKKVAPPAKKPQPVEETIGKTKTKQAESAPPGKKPDPLKGIEDQALRDVIADNASMEDVNKAAAKIQAGLRGLRSKRKGFLRKDQQETQVVGYAGRRVKQPPPIQPTTKDEIAGKPYFLETPVKQKVQEGEPVKFEAEVAGDPEPKLSWMKGARVIRDGGRNMVFYNEAAGVHILEIRKCEPRDTGKYICKIENKNGMDKCGFSLMVEELAKDEMDFRKLLKHRDHKRRSSKDELPDWGKLKHIEQEKKKFAEITFPLQNMTINESIGRARISVGCRYEGVNYAWLKDGKPIETGDKYKMFKKGDEVELCIIDIKPEDTAEYTVTFGDPILASSMATVTIEPAKPRAEFRSRLKSSEVMEGETAKFGCIISSSKLPVSWYKNGKEIKNDNKYEIKAIGSKHELYIKNTVPADEGDLRIIVGDAEDTAALFVKEKPIPEFVKKLKSQEVTEKDRTVLHCELSLPEAKLLWFRDGEPVRPNNRVIIKHEGIVHKLIIEDTTLDDEGEYEVKVQGRDDKSCYCELMVEELKPPLEFERPLKDVGAAAGEEAEFIAEVNDPTADVQWLKDGKPIEHGERFKTIKQGKLRILRIKPVTPGDKGEYTCAAGGKLSKAALRIEVQKEIILKEEIPSKSERQRFPEVQEEHVTDKRDDGVESLPSRPGGEGHRVAGKAPKGKVPTKPEYIDEEGTYMPIRKDVPAAGVGIPIADMPIDDVNRRDRDLDMFASRKPVGKAQPFDDKSPTVDKVSDEPPKLHFPINLRHVKARKKEPIRLEVPVSGKPPPTIRWLKNGKPIVPSKLVRIENTPDKAVLVIPECEKDDTGDYQLEVTNPKGSDVADIKISVMDVPGAPKSVTVTAATKNSASIKWEPPEDDGGAPIKSYTIEKRDAKKDTWLTVEENVPGPEFTVPKLVEGKDYLIRVSAKNEIGLSEPKQIEKPVKAKDPFDEPDAPGQPEVVDAHKDHMMLKWAAPKSDGGSPIKGYVVEKREKGSPRWAKALKEPIKGTEAKVPNLLEGLNYEFRVIAENAAGESEPSKPSQAALAREPIDPAEAPGDLKVGDVTKESAKLSWAKPEDDGGSPISGYVVEKREVGKEKWDKCNRTPVKEENFKVDGLEEEKPYEFRVMAENEAGLSEPSKATAPIVAKDPKVAPKIDLSKLPKEITVKAGQVLKLEAPFSGSPAPEATWLKDGEEVKPTDMVKVDKTPTNSSLTNRSAERGDTGVYELVVTNDSGEEKAKVDVNVLDKPTSPEGPLEVSDVYADSCKLHWKPPKDDGGTKLLNYAVEKRDEKRGTWVPVDDNVSPDKTSLDVKRLTPGAKYDFRVRAENNEGLSEPLQTTKPILAKNPYDEPDEPGKPEITDFDNDFIDLEWAPPEKDGGAPIEGYVVEKRDKAGNRWVPCFDKPVKDNKCKVKDLIEGRDYEFRVSAINKAGKGNPSEVSKTQKVKPKFAKPTLNPNALKDIKVKAGQNFAFEVPIDGAPPPTVTWKKNGEPVTPSDRVQEKSNETQAKLATQKAERGDSGEYELVLTNDQGTTSAKCKVNVLDNPTAPEGPLEVSDVTAESAALSWKPPKDDGGTPISAYVVEKRDTDSNTWSPVSSFVQDTKCNVGKLKEGKKYEFRVRAENEHGGLSEPLVTEQPVLAKNPYDCSDAPGKPEILAYDRNEMTLQWAQPKSDGGAPIQGYVVEKKDTKSNRWTKCSKTPVIGNKFTVPNLIEGKEYQFRVMAENKAGLSEPSPQSNAQIAKPQFEKPKINVDPYAREIKVRAGETLKIDAPIIGSPPPTVTWFKDNKPVTQAGRTTLDNPEDKALLTTTTAERGDTGTYKLQLENDRGIATADFKVIVLDAPSAPGGPLTPNDVDKESVTLTWNEPDDDGGGMLSGYIVEKKKVNEPTWSKVSSNVSSPRYTVKGLEENEDYQFRVRAVNQYGTSEPLVGRTIKIKLPFDAPDAPGTPKIVTHDRRSVSLQWTKPDFDGGNPITGYFIEYKEVDTPKWSKGNRTPCRDTKFTVPDLWEGVEYEFRVMAVNEAGPGKPSRVSDSQVAKDPIFPADAPGRPKFDKITKDSAALSWDKPNNDGGSPITGYVIEKKEPGKDWTEAVSVPAKDTNATVPKLDEGKEYEFRVRAVNESGPGKPSAALKTVVEDKPEKPKLDIGSLKNIKVKAGENFEIKLPFTGVPKPTISWTQRGKDLVETSLVTVKTTSDTTSVTVEDAHRENGGIYKVTLANPSGMDSAEVKVTVLDAPGTPEGPLIASDVTGEVLTLSWKPPKEGADEVDNYIVEKAEAGTGKWKKVTNFCSGTSAKVRNLVEGTEYDFRVKAENQYGASKPLVGDSVVAKNPYDPPGTPGEPKATDTTKDSVTLKWTKPLSDGGNPIIGYVVEKKDATGKKWIPVNKAPTKGTTFTVPRLIEGREYDFRVAAVNDAGPGKPAETSESILAAPPPTRPTIPLEFRNKTITVHAGEPFNINIPFDGSPVPEAIWAREDLDNQEIKPSDRMSFDNDENSVNLKCKFAERDDSGRYLLTLKNPKGTDTANIKVNVVDHPGSPEGPLEVSDVTEESAKLTWNPPKDDGGSPITNYVIEKKEAGSRSWQKVSSFARTPEYTVSGLEEGVDYFFRVRAENEHGVSDPLDTKNEVTAKNPFDPPSAPGKPDFKAIDRGFVTLTWTPPQNDGGTRILGYIVEKKDMDTSAWLPAVEYLVKSPTVSLSNLHETTEYEFRIKAKNKAGLSQPSKNSDAVTPRPQYTTASPPGTPIVDDFGKRHIDLSWSPPKSDGGSPIKGYVVEYRDADGEFWTKANMVPVREPRYTVGDLVENSKYVFRVAAINEAGIGEPSGETGPIEARDKVAGEPAGFIKKLTNTSGVFEQPLKLEVVIKGHPKPDVRWVKDGRDIFATSRYQIRDAGEDQSLTIKELTLADAGEYVCEVRNKLGSAKCTAKIVVECPPSFEYPPKNVSTQVGSSFKVKIPYKGIGNLQVSLSKDGKKLDDKARLKAVVMADYIMLSGKDVEGDDEGVYKVTVSNDIGSDTAPINVKVLQAPDPPRALEVGDVTKSTITISWKPPEYNGGTPVRSYAVERKEDGTDRWITVGSYVKEPIFTAQGLQEGNKYWFRVRAENDVGLSEPLPGKSPIVAKNPFDAPSKPGEPKVTSVGSDFVSLSWAPPDSDGGNRVKGYFVDKAEAGSNRWVRVTRNPVPQAMYNISHLIEDKEYEFRIYAVNDAGESEPSQAPRPVLIKDPKASVRPRFTKQLAEQIVIQGKVATFECHVTGQPKPDIRWLKGSRELYDNDKYLMTREGDKCFLTISNVFGEDTDEYVCEASNRGGKKMSRADLIIKCPPKIKVPPRFQEGAVEFTKGEPLRIKVPITGYPKPTAFWSKEGEKITRGVEATERHTILKIENPDRQHTGAYKIVAENDQGMDHAILQVIISDIPGEVSNVRVRDVTYDTVEITWNAPTYNGGSPISSYVIDKKEEDATNWSRAAFSNTTVCNVQMLSSGKTYMFRVSAENLNGVGAAVEAKHTITTEGPAKRRKIKSLEEEEAEMRRRRVPEVSNYDVLVNKDDFLARQVKIRQGSVHDRYDIGEELGRGDFGVVYRCVERSTGRNFAAKFVDAKTPIEKAAIKAEIQMMNRLQYPKLLQLHDAYEHQDELVMVLEFLSGGDIFDRVLDAKYILTEEEVALYAKQICEGLNYMHTKSIMYLDLKPENVLYESKAGANIKLIDLGSAKRINPEEKAKMVFGSPDFVAPEVLLNETVGFNTDMWTVGVLCYMLLSGIHPFKSDKAKIQRAEWEFDQAAFKGISDNAKDFIKRILVKDKHERLSSLNALDHPWLKDPQRGGGIRIATDKHKQLLGHLKWNTGTSLIPIGRLASMGALKSMNPLEGREVVNRGMSRRDAAPRFIKKPRNVNVTEFNNALFECIIAAGTVPTIIWYKSGKELIQGIKHKAKYDDINYKLQVSRCVEDDNGEYEVRAENSYGKISAKPKLNVIPDPSKHVQYERKQIRKGREFVVEEIPDSAPRFTFMLRSRRIQIGDSVKLSAIVSGQPEAKVSWMFNGRDITPSQDHFKISYMLGMCSLVIEKVTPDLAGKFACVAKNSLGEDVTECSLQVDAVDPRAAAKFGIDLDSSEVQAAALKIQKGFRGFSSSRKERESRTSEVSTESKGATKITKTVERVEKEEIVEEKKESED
ncbi:twitchin-like isoform X3 [Glandiceps talaboti]